MSEAVITIFSFSLSLSGLSHTGCSYSFYTFRKLTFDDFFDSLFPILFFRMGASFLRSYVIFSSECGIVLKCLWSSNSWLMTMVLLKTCPVVLLSSSWVYVGKNEKRFLVFELKRFLSYWLMISNLTNFYATFSELIERECFLGLPILLTLVLRKIYPSLELCLVIEAMRSLSFSLSRWLLDIIFRWMTACFFICIYFYC